MLCKVSLFLCALVVSGTTHGVTLKISTLSPEGSTWTKLLREHGAKVEQRTGGEVKFKFYPGGVMGDDKAVLRKMRVGQLHGAVLTAGALVQSYEDIALYNLPMLFRNEAEVDFVRQAIDERLMQGLRSHKFVGFGLAEVGFAYPMSQQPISSVSSVRQRKVWTPDNDPSSQQAFEAFRISPVPLPIADVLAGLQTGLIDSIASPPIGAIALQWYTQVEYGLDLPLIYVYGTLAMSEKAYARLSEAHGEILTEELGAVVASADEAARKDHTGAKAALTAQGIKWLEPSADERAEWAQLAFEASERIVADGLISAALYEETKALLAEFRAAER
jgi:TRAP-type C4-dicarboxylate transport system substrate-binding protein